MLDPDLRQIVSTASENLRPYDRYGDALEGMSWIPLSGKVMNGEYECFFLRMEAGAESKPHEHTGHEEFLVILRGNNRALKADEIGQAGAG